MQAQQFIRKWQAGAQAHFIDLCRVLGVPEPADPDRYCFERGVARTVGGVHRTKRSCAACWR